MQNTDALLTKKISSPILSRAILHREVPVLKLREVIVRSPTDDDEGVPSYKLVLLCAPAGYGKTTLLADFARHTHMSCCWYFLDSTDAEESNFLQTLILSLLHRFPGLAEALNPLLASAFSADAHHPARMHQFEGVIDALVAVITSDISERFAIFLCNYHAINRSRGVNNLVNQLLYKLPAQCVLVIESRVVPDLDVAPLLAYDEIVGFDYHLLRFTSGDICNLASLQGMPPLTDKEATLLNTLFDGWIAGVLLGTRLGNLRILRTRKDLYTLTSLPQMQIDKQKIFAYLVNEVFSHDMEVYAFLKETAVLRQMIPELCNALLECNDAAARLQYLEQQGLFVTRSGDDPQVVYTCHPLLRELLCDELRRQSFDRFVALHQQAIVLWASAHDYEQAIYHALEIHASEEAANLILETYEQMLEQGHQEIVSRWIDALPSEILAHYPKLFLVRANIYLQLGEYIPALPLLTKASEAISQIPSLIDADELPLFQAYIFIAQSKALYQMGDYLQAQQLCQQVIEQVPADEVTLQAEAHMRLGVCANLLGEFTEGIANLQKALQLWGRESNRRQTAELHTALAGTYRLIGNFTLAEHHLARATKCWDYLQDEWGKVDNLIHAGQIKHHQEEFAEAEVLLQEALTIARGRIRFLRGEAYALVSLGALYQDQELYSQSLTFTEDGLALARRMKDRYLANATLCILAMTYLFIGDVETAMLLVSEVTLEASSDRSGAYEKAKRDLALGTILLCQRRYQEAYTYLSEVENQFRTIGLQEDLVCTVLRLAECQINQGKVEEVARRLESLIALSQMRGYERLVLREFRILPALSKAVKTRPELAPFHKMLQLEVAEEPIKPAEAKLVVDLVVTNTPQLKILALGEPTVFVNDKSITRWRTKRTMELFFLLLSSNVPLRKEQLITALWSEMDEQSDGALHSTIYHLRKLLGVSCVSSGVGVYWLDLPSVFGNEIEYDVAIFQEHAARARKALEEKSDQTARAALLMMVDLYRGDYVQSFYSDWCTFQRDKLRLAYLDARQHLAQIAWRQERFDESALHWQHILAIDPCLEEAHYGLMRSYLRQGKRGLAWRQYQRCVELLRNELGIEPGPAIQNLLQYLTKSSNT